MRGLLKQIFNPWRVLPKPIFIPMKVHEGLITVSCNKDNGVKIEPCEHPVAKIQPLFNQLGSLKPLG